MRKLIAFFLLLHFTSPLLAQTALQKTWCNWVGVPKGITFRYGTPVDFTTTVPPGGLDLPWSSFDHYNGGTSIAFSDSVTGEVKFIATTTTVYNRNYDTVTNGYGLISCGAYSNAAVQVIPFPNGENKFYIIHQFPGSSLDALPGLQTRCSVYAYATGNRPGVYYSILDLDYNNGLGIMTSKNNYLPGGGGENFAQIRHANGKDLWLVGHSGNNNIITKTLFNQTGIEALPLTTVEFPMQPVASTYSSGGTMDASPQGDKIAITSANNRRMNIYSFDKATGTVSFNQSILLPDFASEVCFSPDGTKLYASTYFYSNCGNTTYKLYQIDLSAAAPQQSVYEVYSSDRSGFQMQRIVGHQILLFGHTIYHENARDEMAYHLLKFPNQPQSACTFVEDFFISGAYANMPLLPNDIYQQIPEAAVANFNFPKEKDVCFGSYTMTAPAGYAQYRWNTGETTSSITVSKPGVYSVVAGPNEFSKPTAYGFTNVKAKGQLLDLGPDTLLCPKTSYQFNIPQGFTNLLWQNGDTSRAHTITGSNSGLQVLTATDANGCRVRDSACVRVNYYPRAEFGNDTTLCAGQKLTLHLEPLQYFSNNICLWQDGSTADSLPVRTSGVYWGRTTFNGCTVSDTINVQFIGGVSLNIGSDTTLCEGDSIRLSADIPGIKYGWNTGDTAQSILVKKPGTYIVWADNGQCTTSDTVVVKYSAIPRFSLGPDQKICPDGLLNLSSPITGSYLWSNGSTASALTTNLPGTYWLEITVDGCTYRDSINLLQKPFPLVNLGADTTLCEGFTKTVNVHNDGASYLWSDGSRDDSYTIRHPETVTVIVNLNNCIRFDTVTVRYKKPPFFSLRSDTVMCPGTAIYLQPPVQDGTYAWQDGSTVKEYTVKTPGTYSLQVKNDCGQWRDSVTIQPTLCDLLLPNVFTPNGDGLNDVFRIKFPQYLKNFHLTIYDRRGEKLFETTTAGTGWDGRYKGRDLKMETYVWKIDYTDFWNNSGTKWGTVTLIR